MLARRIRSGLQGGETRGAKLTVPENPDLPFPGDKPLSLSDWLQATAGIVAALGVFLALLFVVLNSAYVYFYEMLGVTPEDVGFDRLAILARTAGLLLPGFILG